MQNLEALRKETAKKLKLNKIPKNIELNLLNSKLKIKTKPMRTQSGVAPVAIMTEPRECPHGSCTFCPGGINSYFGNIPKSYTGNEPASMRAIRNKFDAYLQVFNRLEHYVLLGQIPEKVELIIMGGTFLSYPIEYQDSFIRDTFQAMNDFSELFFRDGKLNKNSFKEFFNFNLDFKSEERVTGIHKKLLSLKRETKLEEEQIKDETAKIRCVALVLETKPDWCKEEHINQALKLGATRIEVGVQSLDDNVLKNVNRGHNVSDTINSFELLKNAGYKVIAHWMPGLPGVDPKNEVESFKKLFSDSRFRPDGLKIYPCIVMPGTPLYLQYKKGKFRPLRTKEAAEIVAECKKFIPKYCRVYRVNRDIPTKVSIDGIGLTNFRQVVHALMAEKGWECGCIRCREPKDKKINWNNVKLNRVDYEASNGKEIFLSFEDENILLGFLRLRFPNKSFRKEIATDSAMIREVHVYGEAAKIGERGSIQHRGLGKKLVLEAERISKENKKNKIIVIAGIGVKEYFKKLGYGKDGVYISKILSR
ncbi:tRNA uridine(34) 5-carboxymethylaminomethyl modification radical SAM/GNAT enzyme Elp3 [Candidatus Woesearchaeota archaeon]|nr:tRNA uridine(34) 5-carboxymethylaminomethyl modification radical SAM/GNAT enzyme Elp3 [Candidatus Woesearchaeota archaeon]